MANPSFLQAWQSTPVSFDNPVNITGITIPAGANRLLLVYPMVGSGGPAAPTGVTLGGIALAQRTGASTTIAFWNADCWYLKESDLAGLGAGVTLATTWATGHDEPKVFAVLYKDVDQTTPFRNASATTTTYNDASGGSFPVSVSVTSSVTDTVVAGVYDGTGKTPTFTTATIRAQDTSILGFEAGFVVEEAGAATVNVAMTVPSPCTGIVIADSLKAAPASAPASSGPALNRERPGRGPYSLGRYYRPIGSLESVVNRTLSDAVAESLSLADTVTAVATKPGTVTEAMSLADTVTGLATYGVSVSEALSLADVVTGLATLPVSIAESLALADTVTGQIVLPVSVAESVSLVDSVSAAATFTASVAESLSLVDSASAVATLGANVAESLSLADSVTGAATYGVLIAESMAMVDTIDATAGNAVVAESMSLTDVVSASAVFTSVVAEAMSLTDTIVGNQASSAAVSESMSLVDTVTEGSPAPASDGHSGVTRQWLIDYYERAWAKKPAPTEAPKPPVAAKLSPATAKEPEHDGLDELLALARAQAAQVDAMMRRLDARQRAAAVVTEAAAAAPTLPVKPATDRKAARRRKEAALVAKLQPMLMKFYE